MKSSFYSLFLLSLLLSQCRLPTSSDTLLELESLSESLVNLQENTQAALAALNQQANSINIQGRALTQEELKTVSRITAFQQQFTAWKEKHNAAKLIIQNTQPDPDKQLKVLQQLQKEIIALQQRMKDF